MPGTKQKRTGMPGNDTMAEKRDYYEVLGLPRDADEAAVKKAYRNLAMKHHPDRNQGNPDSERLFKEAAEAYEVLSNADKRARYDQFGHAGMGGAAGGGAGPQNMDDILRHFAEAFGGQFGGNEEMFEQMFGGGGRGGRGRTGSSLRVVIEMDFKEALETVTKTIHFRRHEHCSTCKGSGAKPGSSPKRCATCGGHGQVQMNQGFFSVRTTCPHCHGRGTVIDKPCETCSGSGRERVEREVEIKIPAGIDDGMTLRVAGEGDEGEMGGMAGDLLAEIHVKAHEIFQRREADVVMQLPIGFAQAALGDKVDIPTPRGEATLKIPAGTQSHTTLRLRGEGFPNLRGGGKGDLLVEVAVEVPRKLTGEQERLLKEFGVTERENPGGDRKTFWGKVKGIFR